MLSRSLLVITVFFLAACGSKKGSNASTPNSQNQTPPPIAPYAQNYGGNQLNPNTALQGMGQWVVIDGQNFFVPDRSRLSDPNDWQPYQDGRWTYDKQRGWTWVSSEPWGWMTDHYGVWRHHNRHGWIWLAFDDLHYEPHCATWFDDGDYVGWYPYFPNFSRAYRLNDRHGFNDGYWRGRESVLSIGVSGPGLFFGFTLVNRSDATAGNIRRHMIRDRGFVRNVALRAHQGDRFQRVGSHPGGHLNNSYDFLQRYSTARAPVGDAQWVKSRGGARILQPYNGRVTDRHDHDRRDNDRRDDRPPVLPSQPAPQQWQQPQQRRQPPAVQPLPTTRPAWNQPSQQQADKNPDRGRWRDDDNRDDNGRRPHGKRD